MAVKSTELSKRKKKRKTRRVALASLTGDVALMAEAFKKAIEAGRSAYLAGLGRTLERGASASSPLTGFLQEQEA